MADETFGVSIVEAQASGLPVVGVAAGAMIDRVTDGVGHLGPIDDSEAMARNILDVWQTDLSRMSEQARAHALQFSWERSMEALFGEVYPAAFARRAETVALASARSAGPLVRA
jgi:glycosyltransferase involved in cell wall biosynthesis